MAIETVEEARALFERTGGRVVRATLHEEGGDRQVWFVGSHGWCYLVSDEKLIAFAQTERSAPLVSEAGVDGGVAWPPEGSGEYVEWPGAKAAD